MKKTDVNTVVFNAAGLGLIVFLGAYMVNAALHTEKAPRCSAHYGDGQQFALQRAEGEPMSPMELQARLPTREWGLLENARVVTDKNAAYLQVALGPRNGIPSDEVEPTLNGDGEEVVRRDGVGFAWQPANLATSRAACLSYRVYLSKDFAFTDRGTLPGLFGVEDLGKLDANVIDSGFVSRVGWDKNGSGGLSVKTPLTAGMWIPAKGFLWPTNRWVSVEQETVLNTPDRSDGVMRLWIDGQLRIEQTNLNLGAKETSKLTGIVADIGNQTISQSPARVTLSPFVVQSK